MSATATATTVQTELNRLAFTTKVAELADRLPAVLRAIDKRDPSGLFSALVVEVTDEGAVHLKGANALWRSRVTIPAAKVSHYQPGMVLVHNPTNFAGVLSRLADDADVTFTVDDGKITVTALGIKAQFPLLILNGDSAGELADIAGDRNVVFTAPVDKLTAFFKAVAYATARWDNASNPIFANVFLRTTGEETAVAVATDSSRLALAQLDAPVTTQVESALVPIEAVEGVLGILGRADDEADVTVSLVDNRFLLFSFGDTEVAVRLSDGQYPNYERVLPNESAFGVKVNIARKVLHEALRRVATASSYSETIVRIEPIADDAVRVSLVGDYTTDYEETITAEVFGYDASKNYSHLAFNVRFVMEAVVAEPAENIDLFLGNPAQPLFIKGDGAILALLMPVRV